ncbi:MAG: ABC transporter ATP-binding protein, partial [Candidatus Dadabacteria bacterium]
MSAVTADNLTKAYRIYRSPAERLKEIVLRRSFHTDFVALDSVSFLMEPGDTLGIIGENGAGKSTLLKILAGTIRPTSGVLYTSGRTAALLELGAGFNPELTGHENIYLNAYLMGLTREDIDRRKADIVSFAELGDFISRPVKTYSSRMYVRLAFSIATSVDPDILIIDEALSVGDEYFQKKCIDRMMDFRARGKTILFCSHSMYHVQELCTRAIWLDRGRVRKEGETGKVILEYQGYERGKTAALKESIADMMSGPGADVGKQVRIVEAKVLNRDGIEAASLKTLDPVTIAFRIRTNGKNANGHIGFAFIRND